MEPEDPEGDLGGSSVFVLLTIKVAKTGRIRTVLSGMHLALAGGVWRPIPAQEGSSMVCYNVYPPTFYDFE